MGVHPAIVAMLQKAREAGVPALSAAGPAEARALHAPMRILLGPGVAVGGRSELSIPTRAGAIPAVLFTPKQRACGLLVFLHGGGWVIGAPADYEVLARSLVAQSGCAVLVPDYRLAPEYAFPAGLEDCEDAVLWSHAECSRLIGVDAPLVVGGDSAGGNLTAVVVSTLRDRVPFAGQILIYPVTDADFATSSYAAYGTDLPLSGKDMRWFFEHYAPEAAWSDPRISPLRQTDLRGLPPCVVITAENDVLRDEGEAYAAKLEAVGVPVVLRRYSGMTHGFIRLHDLVDTAGAAVHDMATELRRLCGVSVAGNVEELA